MSFTHTVSRRLIFTFALFLGALLSFGQTDFQLAEQYYEKEEYKKALKYLEPLHKKSKSKRVYTLSLNSYLALEEYKDARKLIRDFIAKNPGNSYDYYPDLVFVYIQMGEPEKADETVDEIRGRLNASPGMAYGFANAFQKKGYPKIALEVYELAEARMPGSNFDYQKALLYGELGDVKSMYAAYVRMVVRTPNYLNTVKQLMARALNEETSFENTDYMKELIIKEIQAGGPSTLNELLVFIYIREGNFRGAFTQLKALDKRNPTNRGQMYDLGVVSLENEEFQLAGRIFDYVADAGSDNPYYEDARLKSLSTRSAYLEKEASTDIAAWQSLDADYEKLGQELAGMPETGELAMARAKIMAFKLNQSEEAIKVLKSILKVSFISKEDQALAKIQLGDIMLYSGNRWDAILYYGQAEKAFEQSPIGQLAKFKKAKAAYYVGDFQWAQGIFDALKASTSKLIANDAMRYSLLINDNIALDTNTDAMTLFARADFLNYQLKTDSVLAILQTIQNSFPGHTIQDEVLLLRAEILTKRASYEEAATDLKTIVEQHADGILADDALYELARLHELHFADRDKAMDLYQRLFTEHPDSFFATDARKRFRELRGDVLN